MGCLCHDLKEKFHLITEASSSRRFGPTLKRNGANNFFRERFADDLKIKRGLEQQFLIMLKCLVR